MVFFPILRFKKFAREQEEDLWHCLGKEDKLHEVLKESALGAD